MFRMCLSAPPPPQKIKEFEIGTWEAYIIIFREEWFLEFSPLTNCLWCLFIMLYIHFPDNSYDISVIILTESCSWLKSQSNIVRDINYSRYLGLCALRVLRKHNSPYNSPYNSPLASSAGFLSTLRASLTITLRKLTHFSNYAATTVAELKRGKELSLW